MSAPTPGSLLGRRLRTRPGALLLLALLVLLSAAVTALVPRLLVREADAELQDRLTQVGAVARSIQGSGDFVAQQSSSPRTIAQIYAPFDSTLAGIRSGLPSPLRAGVGAPSWIVQTPLLPVEGAVPGAALRLTGDARMAERIRLTSGAMPAVWAGDDADPAPAAGPIDIAVGDGVARRLGLTVGDVLTAATPDGGPRPAYRVSGIFTARDRGDEYWQHDPTLLRTSELRTPDGADLVGADAYVAPATVGRLSGAFATARISAFYPVRSGAWRASDAGAVERQLAALTTSDMSLPGDAPLAVSTGAAGALQEASARVRALSTLLALIAAAPAGVLLAVLGMAARAMVAPWRPDIALALARGASPTALRMLLAAAAALPAAPAAVVAIGAATLAVPAPTAPLALVLPILAAALPVVVAASAVETPATARVVREAGRFRSVALIALVLLSFLAVLVLIRRGLAVATDAGFPDPLLVATPLLLSITAAALVLRGYPLALAALAGAARRGRGALAFVGALRASRAPATGAMGVAALLVGVSTALLSSALLGAVDGAVANAAARSIGADARIDGDATATLRPATIAHVRGVRAVAGIEHRSGLPLEADRIRDSVELVLAQTGPLSSLRSGLPALPSGADGAVPVAVSRDLTPELRVGDTAHVGDVEVRVAALVPIDGGLGPTRSWILADASAAPRFGAAFRPDVVLVRARDDGALRGRLRAAAGTGASVATVASDISARSTEPAVAAVRAGLAAGTIGSAALALLAVALAVVGAGAARARTVGVLRTLGMPPTGARTLVAWELVPVAVTTVLAGCLLGVLLPLALSAAIDLRPLLDASAPGPALVPPAVLIAVAVGFSVGSAATGAAAVVVSGRIHPVRAAKMGEG